MRILHPEKSITTLWQASCFHYNNLEILGDILVKFEPLSTCEHFWSPNNVSDSIFETYSIWDKKPPLKKTKNSRTTKRTTNIQTITDTTNTLTTTRFYNVIQKGY